MGIFVLIHFYFQFPISPPQAHNLCSPLEAEYPYRGYLPARSAFLEHFQAGVASLALVAFT